MEFGGAKTAASPRPTKTRNLSAAPDMTDAGQTRRLKRAKVVVLGGDNCGKTALCVRFITKRFIGEYDHKKEMTYRCRKVLDKEAIDLEILDTVNKDSGPPANTLESAIKWGDGFLIMYSVTDRSSFQSVSSLKRLIDSIKQTPGEFEELKDATHMVPSLSGWCRCHFCEVSVAEDRASVDAAVTRLVQQLRLEFHKQLLVLEKRSRVLHMKEVLRSKLTRSKTMQW
ncbi:ras-related and estrogen-regulated growth inhibitor-like [Arapaima gigas]